MNCRKCNSPIEEDSAFCKKCGKPVLASDRHLRSFLIKTVVVVGAVVLIIAIASIIYLFANDAIRKNEQNQLEQNQSEAKENEKQQEYKEEVATLMEHADIIQHLNQLAYEEYGKLNDWLADTTIIPDKKVHEYEEAGYFLDFVLDEIRPARIEYMETGVFFETSFSSNSSDVKKFYKMVKELYKTCENEVYGGENEFAYPVDEYYQLIEEKYEAVSLAYQECQGWYDDYMQNN